MTTPSGNVTVKPPTTDCTVALLPGATPTMVLVSFVSTSVSLVSTFPERPAPLSTAVIVSATPAIGSLVPVIVNVMVAVSVPPCPSETV